MVIDRVIQIIAAVVLIVSVSAAGRILPGIVKQADDSVLRYTNVSVEGAPPWVAIGTAFGALRGLVVDVLWIKANAMKEKGLYYEAMADADLICKLQPRFARVWAFHGHNMAYNISVATYTKEERWEWVNAGIRLVRERGIRFNPNDIELHRELAFWFSHKIEGVADDAHLYYKREFCREWHLLLGAPPADYQERIAWMKEIADAPETLEQAERSTPGVKQIVDRLQALLPPSQAGEKIKLDRVFMSKYVLWQEVAQRSAAAKLLKTDEQFRKEISGYEEFDALASDPELQAAWRTLIAHIRKRVLIDEYNMDPQLMYEYTRDMGPLDWRHASSHALYWARRGSQFGHGRLVEDDRYIALNTDAAQMHAMQDLTHYGRISFDPLSSQLLPGRFPELKWIDTIDRMFEELYEKYYTLRGAGGERFITFLKNYLSSAAREWYRAGEVERAQQLLDRLDSLFGYGPTGIPDYRVPLDVFVWDLTEDQYQAQPHIAPTEIAQSLRHGLYSGILSGREKLLIDALLFADQVTRWYRENDWNDYVNQYGEGRLADLVHALEDSIEMAYLQLLTDPSVSLAERREIWARTDRVEQRVIREAPQLLGRQAPALRALVYDRAIPMLQAEFQRHELRQAMSFEEAFPAPPGLEQARQLLEERKSERQQKMEEIRERDPFLRKS